MLSRYFQFEQLKTSYSQEVRAGCATFLAMSYILFVNPMILESAINVPSTKELVAGTAIAAAIGCLAMGLWARLPFALAPGMGLNAYFSFTMVGAQGLSWHEALGCVFVSGVLFLIISAFGLRTMILTAIPRSLKIATTCGIGFFIAFIGLKTGGVIVANPATLVSLGEPMAPGFWLTFGGFFLLAGLMNRKISGAFLWSIGAVTAVGMLFHLPLYAGGRPFAGFPQGVFDFPYIPSATFLAMDLGAVMQVSMLAPILTLLFVDFFDTAGTLFGLAQESGYLDADGQITRGREAFVVDAIATMASAVVGTSPTTTYIESAAGIEEGGRSGFTAVVVGLLFLMALCFTSVVAVVPPVATAPALLMVGALMMKNLAHIRWGDALEALPAFVLIVVMPLSFSITHGISAGIVTYVVLALLKGAGRQIHPVTMVLALLIVLRYLYLGAA